jgi:hypothetical protein
MWRTVFAISAQCRNGDVASVLVFIYLDCTPVHPKLLSPEYCVHATFAAIIQSHAPLSYVTLYVSARQLAVRVKMLTTASSMQAIRRKCTLNLVMRA